MIRQQRHLGMRIIISTQGSSVLSIGSVSLAQFLTFQSPPSSLRLLSIFAVSSSFTASSPLLGGTTSSNMSPLISPSEMHSTMLSAYR